MILAAACDFSKKARDAFYSRGGELGFSELYLWGRGELEDMLFQPKNDHLLFAYFGISLQTRRRQLKTNVRARLAAKRKAERLMEGMPDVLVRDATDDRYPYLVDDNSKARWLRGRWKVMTMERLRHYGLHFEYAKHMAYLDPDGVHWDFAETYNEAGPFENYDPWRQQNADRAALAEAAHAAWMSVPEDCRGWFNEWVILPFESIIDIDAKGDEVFQGPHIYTVPYGGGLLPFLTYPRTRLRTLASNPVRRIQPDEKNRVEVFPRPPKKPETTGS